MGTITADGSGAKLPTLVRSQARDTVSRMTNTPPDHNSTNALEHDSTGSPARRQALVERLSKLGFDSELEPLTTDQLKQLKDWLARDVASPTLAMSLALLLSSLFLLVTSGAGSPEAATPYQIVLWLVAFVSLFTTLGFGVIVLDRLTRWDRSVGLAAGEVLRLTATDRPPHLPLQRRYLSNKLRPMRAAASRAGIAIVPRESLELIDSPTPYESAAQWTREFIVDHLTDASSLSSEFLMTGWFARIMSTKAGKIFALASTPPIALAIVKFVISLLS